MVEVGKASPPLVGLTIQSLEFLLRDEASPRRPFLSYELIKTSDAGCCGRAA